MDSWLDSARQRIAVATGGDAGTLGLSESDVTALLDLARVAAHESGDRTNAPLVCFLVGLAIGRGTEIELRDLVLSARGDAA